MIDDNLLAQVANEDAERIREIGERWSLYDGEHPASLNVQVGRPDDNVTIGNHATNVNTGVEFLYGEGVEFHVAGDEREPAGESEEDEEAEAENDPADLAQAYLDTVWRRNAKKTLLREHAINCGVAGHGWLKFVPHASGDTKSTAHRIIVMDPQSVTAFWAPDDIGKLLALRVMHNTTDDDGETLIVREDHILADDESHWIIRRWEGRVVGQQAQGTTRSRFNWQRTDDGADEIWPHEWPQIIGCKNLPAPNEFYGRSDIGEDLQQINRTINRVASHTAKTLRLFAHPRPWATGDDPKALRKHIDNAAAVGAMLCLPTGSVLNNMQMQADALGASMDYLERLDDKYFEVARIPRIATGKVDNIGALSGVAMLIMYRPLIAKNQTKRDLQGDMLVELNRRILAFAGFGPDVETVNMWPDVLPRNEKEEAETAVTLGELGVSKRTRLERLGFDPDLETERLQEEDLAGTGDQHGMGQRIAELTANLAAAQPQLGDIPAA